MEVSGHHPRAAVPAAFSQEFGDAPYHFGGAGSDVYVDAVAARATAHRTGSHDAVRTAGYHAPQKAARPSENCAEVSEHGMSDDDLYGADGDDVISACLTSSEDEDDDGRMNDESDDDDDSDAEGEGDDGGGAHWAALAQLMPHSAPCLSSLDAADMYGKGAEELPADAPDEASALQRSGGGNGISSTSRREFNRTGSAGYRPALRASQMSAAAAAAATAASASAATRSPPQYLPSGAAAASASPQRLTTTSPSSFSPNVPANTPTAPPSLSHSPKRYNSPASSAYSISPPRYPHPPTGAALLSSQPSFVSPYRSSSPICPPDAQNASAAGASRSPPPHSSGPRSQGQSSSPQPFAHSPTYPDHSPSALNQMPNGSGYSMRSTSYGAPGRSSSPSPGANGYGTGSAPNTAGGRSSASGEAVERRRSSAERSEHPYRRQQSEPAMRALPPTLGQLPAAAVAATVAPTPCERVPRSFSNSSRSSAGDLTAHRPRHSISESMKNAARAAVQAASVASQNSSHDQQHHSQAQQSKGAASGRSCTMTEGSYAASRSTPGLDARPKRIVAAAVPAAAAAGAGAGAGAGAVAASAVAAVAATAGPPPMQRKSRSLTRTDGDEFSLKQMLLQADKSVPVSPPQALLSRVPTTKRRGKDTKLDLDARVGESAGEMEGKPLQRTRSGNKTVLVFEIPDPEPVRDLEEKPFKVTGSRSSSRGMRSGSLTTTSAAAVPSSRSTVQADSCSAGCSDSAAATSQPRSTSKPRILKGILKSSKSQKDVGGRAAGSEPGAVAASSKPRAKSAGVKRVYV